MSRIYLDIKYGKSKIVRGYLLDMSLKGMGIATDVNLAEGTLVEVNLKEAENADFLKGKVISSGPREKKRYRYRVGVKFIERGKRENINRALFTHIVEKIREP